MAATASNPDRPTTARGLRWRADLALGCAVSFVVLTTAAMVVFPGGATFEILAHHYLFFGNYLSDLGATHTYSGQPNTASRVLFTTALVGVGISLALFGPAWRAWANRGTGKVIGTIGSAGAVLSGCCFIATAFTPWDRDYDRHTAFVRAAFGLLFVFVACLATVQLRNGAPRRWIVANFISLMALIVYIAVVAHGPSIFTPDGLEVQVATQKATVYITVANLGLQAWGVGRRTRRDARVRSSQGSSS